MPRLYVTGAGGFIGSRLIALKPASWQVVGQWRRTPPPEGAVATPCLDLGDEAAVATSLRGARPDVVLHLAYDIGAGSGPNLAWSRNVFAGADAIGAAIVFMSTDLVFDGNRGWYHENEPVAPTIDYGRWKATLEAEVATLGGVSARTSLVWSADPPSVPIQRMILDPLQRGESPRLFADEWRSPTDVTDLARGLWEVVQSGARGTIVHLAGPERITRYEHGQLIARKYGFVTDFPPSYRAQVAPDRPRDTTLAMTAVTHAIVRTTRFRGPSEILA